MLFIAGLRHEGSEFMLGWIAAQSGVKIIYDFVFSFAAVFVAKYAKIILWFLCKELIYENSIITKSLFWKQQTEV